jgi:magnesium-transporting ATPase (P-type)
MNFYQFDTVGVLKQLKTQSEGLTAEQADQRLRQYGPNKIAEEMRTGRLKIFLRQFTSPLIYILLIAALVTFLLQSYSDTGVILAVVAFNALIGYLQEFKAEESMRALKRLMVPKARVLRENREREINSEELVPGDIVLLASGAKVPADLRLTSTLELKIDESMLTGESLPAEKRIEPIKENNLSPGDQRNMAFTGTVVVNGRGRGVVVATGNQTVLGGIAAEVKGAEGIQAPLQQKFHKFSKRIGLIVLAASVLLFLIGVLIGENLEEMFMTAVAAAVATVPEGLPVVLTIALAVGLRRMAKRHAIIRKLAAVETLGSTTVICTDKTGTLTKNEMTVKVIFDGEHVFEVTGSGYDPEGEILHEWMVPTEEERKNLFMSLRIGLLCNESHLYKEEEEYKVDGDPTEGALIVSALKGGLNPEKEKKLNEQVAILPFESERGFMATLHVQGSDRKRLIFIKGAPEKVLELCTSCLVAEGLRTEGILQTADRFAKEGMRVLAMAYREAPETMEELNENNVRGSYVLAGIQGMMDPPRAEVIGAIKGCRKAGIRVVMITGDHPTTAVAIGKMLGISHDTSEVLIGRDIEGMDDVQLFDRVRTIPVYARVAPNHKLRIVEQLMKQGEIVAVTGDGVNDAPALKKAHIGVAMGKKGTDVAKEASDMVITDDNFATIFSAVEEGRVVFDNIRKVVFFLIPTGVAAIGSIVGSILMGLPMPYTPSQLLWINLVTNGFQVIALTFEPKEHGVTSRPPRDPREGVMSRVLIERTILVGLLISIGVIYQFIHALDGGVSLDRARTVAVTTMVFFQFFQAWNSRSESKSIFRTSFFSNPWIVYGLMASILAQLASIYLPALQWIFKTEPLTFLEWVKIAAMSLTVILLVEVDKGFRRSKMQ